MLDMKEEVYKALSAIDFPIQDNPNGLSHSKCPYSIIRTIGCPKREYKNYFKVNWLLRVDVFSNYKGEAEILNYYNQVLDKLKQLRQQIKEITYITPDITIMDEKELGPVNKHGVISINIDTMEVEA